MTVQNHKTGFLVALMVFCAIILRILGKFDILICQYKCNSYFKNFLMTSAGERKPKRFLGRLLISSTTLAS